MMYFSSNIRYEYLLRVNINVMLFVKNICLELTFFVEGFAENNGETSEENFQTENTLEMDQTLTMNALQHHYRAFSRARQRRSGITKIRHATTATRYTTTIDPLSTAIEDFKIFTFLKQPVMQEVH